MFFSCWKVKGPSFYVDVLPNSFIFMQKSLSWDTLWKSWTLGLFFSLLQNQVEQRHLWRIVTVENQVQHAWIKAKQSPMHALLWTSVSPTCPLPMLGFTPTPRLCPHLRRHQGQSEYGQSCFLGSIASAVIRGRLSLLIWLLNPSQLHMWCLTNILEWTNV